MDTFFEHIITIKKSKKVWAVYFVIWGGALLLEAISLLMLLSGFSLAFLLMAAIIFAAFKLSGTLNIEYEYIITNGIMDIDKIINKANRKRMLSFEISKITRMEVYNDRLVQNINAKEILFACNTTDPDVYFLSYEKNGKTIYLVVSLNEKMKTAFIKYLPKFISNSLFK